MSGAMKSWPLVSYYINCLCDKAARLLIAYAHIPVVDFSLIFSVAECPDKDRQSNKEYSGHLTEN